MADPDPDRPLAGYELKKERERERNAKASAASAEIGELPKIAKPQRKKKCREDFKAFCESYLPNRFGLKWSPDHLQVIDRIERAVLHGALFALAMPRGSGKTSICEAACLWAALYGHHQFIALVGASLDAAKELLDSIKTEIESNPLLAEDFPEVCVPIAKLEGAISRQRKQTHKGKRTRMQWNGQTSIVLPDIEKSPASGVIVKCSGINGRLRGMKHTRTDGTIARPTLSLIDDPQTDTSANNPRTCTKRLKTINGTILRAKGPDKAMAALAAITVIQEGDLADQLLDREANPKWQGEKFQALYEFPEDMDSWRTYAEMRADEFRAGGDGSAATAWYKRRRKKMDAGAVVAWPERFEEGEISGVQHCMNVFFDDPETFAAEYQNNPLVEESETNELDEKQISTKVNGIPRGVVPSWADRLVAFCDVQKSSLWYVVTAFDESFSGAVIDYGVYPKQRSQHVTKKTIQHTLKKQFPKSAIEGQIRSGIDAIVEELVGREWERDGGGSQRIERMLVDRGFMTDVVDQACRSHTHAPILRPAKGRGIGAKRVPMSKYKKRSGERMGNHWIDKKEGPIRWLDIDTNYWKSFVAARLNAAMGDKGSLSLFGRQPHKLFASHCTAEKFTRVEAEGTVVEEWDLKPNKPDNEFLDGLVGCHVAASMLGANLLELASQKKKRKKRKRQAEYL